jgi:hypothetical protein
MYQSSFKRLYLGEVYIIALTKQALEISLKRYALTINKLKQQLQVNEGNGFHITLDQRQKILDAINI